MTNVLKTGLERTLSEARYLSGTIEKDPDGGHSFVKRKTSTVNANPWITWGERRPEADPDHAGAVVAAYQTKFIPDGMVLSMHSHHYACDVMGWSNFTRQLAENCYAIWNGTSFPPWDPACIDASRFTELVPESDQALLFHLPKRKAAILKQVASPKDGSSWISTYDAVVALLWRQLSRVRLELYDPDLSGCPSFSEAINMRPRIHNPDLLMRMMRNVLVGVLSEVAPVRPPTWAEVTASEDEYPLSKLAVYNRRIVDSVTQEQMESVIDSIAPIRGKRSIRLRFDRLPAMAICVSDHRPADVGGLNFGFGNPITHRHPWGENVPAGVVVMFAPLANSNPAEGLMLTVTVEKALVSMFLESEWTKYFGYQGTD